MAAVPELTPEVYEHLRHIAGRIYAERGFGHATMQPTALLHEAWMKVADSSARYESRAHFMATAARAMRQILVDRARAHASQKRGGDRQQTTLAGLPGDLGDLVDVLALDQALTQLEALDVEAARVVQLRTFGASA